MMAANTAQMTRLTLPSARNIGMLRNGALCVSSWSAATASAFDQ